MPSNRMRVDPLFADLVRRKQTKYKQKGFDISIPNVTKLIAIDFDKIPPQQRRWEIKLKRCKLKKVL